MTTLKSQETKRRLVRATIETIAEGGIAKVSARTVADRAGLAQGLVFYHFGGVTELVGAACLSATRERVERYEARFEAVSSFADLVELAAQVHREEREEGNVTILAQVLAAAQSDPAMAEIARDSLGLWTARVRDVARRVLAGSPFASVIGPDDLAELVSSAFIGIELTDPVRGGEGVERALAVLGSLARAVDGLGPVARRAVRAALK